MNRLIKTGTFTGRMLLVLLFINPAVIAQNKEQKRIDSLKMAAASKTDDTSKVNALSKLAFDLGVNDPQQALNYGEAAIKLAQKLKWPKGEANGLANTGYVYLQLSEYAKAIQHQEKALKIFEKIKYEYGMSRCYIIMANAYNYLSDHTKAMEYQKKALKIGEKTNDKIMIRTCLLGLGLICETLSDYPQAVEYFEKALRISEEKSDSLGIGLANGNLGIIFYDLADYPRAVMYMEKALEVFEELGDKQRIGKMLLNVGNTYHALADDSKALVYYEKSLKIMEELGNKYTVALCLSAIGNIYDEQHEYAKALEYYERSLKIGEETHDKRDIGLNMNSIANVYIDQKLYGKALEYQKKSLKIFQEIDDKRGTAIALNGLSLIYQRMSDYPKALGYANKALTLAREIGVLETQREALQFISETSEKMGQSKKALEYYKMYITFRDSIINEKNTKKTIQTHMQYEFDKKESLAKAEQQKKDILALKELQKQKLLKYSFLGGIGLVLLLFFFIYRSYSARQELRLHDIRNRIAGDLHDDIGSTLNSISIYSEVARKNDEHHDEALQMIGDASRKIIEAMSDIVWTINAENDSFEKIIFRMKSLTYNLFRAKQIEYTFQADEILNEKKLSLEERRNFYLIFKEAVNNLVKYARATRVAITLTYENKQIRLRIQDNGVGFDTAQDTAGNGLKNIKRRAQEMKAEFVIESKIGEGTQIELTLKA